MSEELRPCPFCGKEPAIDNNFAICVNDDCELSDYWSGLEDCSWNTRPIEDALNARIAELEADKERLNSCESALISMVQQFFYNKDGEDAFRHSFMSAEEEAATYLVEHGIARWADKRKSSIYFNEVQE